MKEEKKEETIDRRIRKTRRLLRECLTALLKEKKVQDITVREIADMADINRGTFYLHKLSDYSFRIAASGLSFIARFDGKYPAAMPITTAKITDAPASQSGI